MKQPKTKPFSTDNPILNVRRIMKRIQRKRTKGWKMPENCRYVGRPTKFGNPFSVERFGREMAVEMFHECLSNNAMCYAYLDKLEATTAFNHMKYISEHIEELRGKNLACFCALDKICHADVLLEILS